jgi:hypothetical protein
VRLYEPFFRVPYIGAMGGWSNEWQMPAEEMHKLNLEYLQSVVDAFEQSASTKYLAKNGYENEFYWHARLIKLCEQVHRYEFMSGVNGTLEGASHIGQRIEKARAEKMARYNSPINVAKRERAKARKLAIKALSL